MFFFNIQLQYCKTFLSTIVLLFLISCYKGDIDLKLESFAKLSGYVIGPSDIPVDNVKVQIFAKGTTYEASTNSDGYFIAELENIERGEGYNFILTKDSYATKNMSAIFLLPNLRLHFDKIDINVSGNEFVRTRTIQGRVLDNFSYNSLVGATVQTTNILGDLLVTTTDNQGFFQFENTHFAVKDVYTILIQKENYIRRSNINIEISGVTNEFQEGIRLFRQYGGLQGAIKQYSYMNGARMPSDLRDTTISIFESGRLIYTEASPTSSFEITNVETQDIYLGGDYTIKIEKTGYKTLETNFSIDTIDSYNIGEIYLYNDVTVSGTITNGADARVLLSNGSNTFTYEQEIVADSSGDFSFSNTDNRIAVGRRFTLLVSKPGYRRSTTDITITTNNAQTIALVAVPAGANILRGRVVDIYRGSNIEGAMIEVVNTSGGSSNTNGEFNLTGGFVNGSDYTIRITHPQYTAENSIVYENTFSYMGGTESPRNYELEDIQLYPIGIFYHSNGTPVISVNKDIKQTLEDFLTGNVGLTITARQSALQINGTTFRMNNPSEDINGQASFFLHIDAPSNRQPIPLGKAYADITLPLNIQNKTDHKRRRGYYSEDITSDSRVNEWNVDRKSYFRFYVPQFLENLIVNIDSTRDLNVNIHNRFGSVSSGVVSNASSNSINLTSIQSAWYILSVVSTNSTNYGFFDISLSSSDNIGTSIISANTTYATDNVVLSGLLVSADEGTLRPSLYVAGKNETYNNQTSSASIYLEKIGNVGDIIRGRFYGRLILIPGIHQNASSVREITNTSNSNGDGYFNIIRQE